MSIKSRKPSQQSPAVPAVPVHQQMIPHPAAAEEKPAPFPLLNRDCPENVRDILMSMQIADRQNHEAVRASGGDYNPAWRILANHINDVYGRIEALLAPLEFEYAPGRPLMVVKLGSDSKGWIPGPKHFDHVRKQLKASGEDTRSNILLYNYAIQVEFPRGTPHDAAMPIPWSSGVDCCNRNAPGENHAPGCKSGQGGPLHR